ncbi:MAG: transketolase C-terminal domain-containing protein [Candidatus Nanopelagicales bacterium]|nr:transketolase C-terminal domain-containing protein [Candidatus Nanopelagicales bacterium]
MRGAFARVTTELIDTDERVVALLGDIGVFAFRHAKEAHPDRVYNIGILEQSTIGLGAGLAKGGLIPVIHTIAPFLVERALEQIKIDFAYQQLPGNLVSVGASVDYAALGCTHHCPGDVGILSNVPGVQILVPGTAAEFESLYRQTYANASLTYTRISELVNADSSDVEPGRIEVLRTGAQACVVAFGPVKDAVLEACADADVTVLYCTSVQPFDAATLRAHAGSGRILLVEPFYEYSTAPAVLSALQGLPAAIASTGIPREFLRGYGSVDDHYEAIGLTPRGIRASLDRLIDG